MKRNLTGVLLMGLIMGACNHTPKEGAYHLRGVVTNEKLEGRTIYLRDAIEGVVRYDSTTVSEGRFMFNGKVTAPQVRELFIQETDSDRFPVTLPVVLEPGEINAKIGDIVLVEGTGLNEEMMQTLMALDEFRGRDFTGKEINEIKEAFGGFVLEQIVKHAGSRRKLSVRGLSEQTKREATGRGTENARHRLEKHTGTHAGGSFT